MFQRRHVFDTMQNFIYRLTTLESCLVVLFPYASYMLADALDLSGIVAILFAGIVSVTPNIVKKYNHLPQDQKKSNCSMPSSSQFMPTKYRSLIILKNIIPKNNKNFKNLKTIIHSKYILFIQICWYLSRMDCFSSKRGWLSSKLFKFKFIF